MPSFTDRHPNTVHGRVLLALLCAPLVLLVACGRADSNATEVVDSPSRTIHTEVGMAPGGGTVVTVDDIRIEVARDVSLKLPMGVSLEISEEGEDGERREVVGTSENDGILIDGEELQIVDGVLMIGTVDHGPVTLADLVEISKAGVNVRPRIGLSAAE
jgi:outer membrane receptor for ferrienterochelin and colicin